jgi:hypothetical protein
VSGRGVMGGQCREKRASRRPQPPGCLPFTQLSFKRHVAADRKWRHGTTNHNMANRMRRLTQQLRAPVPRPHQEKDFHRKQSPAGMVGQQSVGHWLVTDRHAEGMQSNTRTPGAARPQTAATQAKQPPSLLLA